MSQSEPTSPSSGPATVRHDPKVRAAIQVFQFFLLVMLAMQVFVQKRAGERAVTLAQQKAYQTETELRREIFDLKNELAQARDRVKELEKMAR